MYSEKQLKELLDKAIEKCVNDTKKYLEETVVSKFNAADELHKKYNIVMDFIDSIDYDI